MRLRIAKKIYKTIGTPDENRYTAGQLQQAMNIVDRMRDSREAYRLWVDLLSSFSVLDRADMVRKHNPAKALSLLMDTPEEEWDTPFRLRADKNTNKRAPS